MEQTRFFRSHNFQLANTTNSSSLDESWEEQAFAEDAAGALGGCTWPPRSYSCSFCGREFRSAQALGGHMNVHRREKARSKQSPASHSEILNLDEKTRHNRTRNSFQSSVFQYPSQVCRLVYNPNPKTDFCNTISPPSSSSRVSTPSDKDFGSERILFSPMAKEKEDDRKFSADGISDEHEYNQRIIEQQEKTEQTIIDCECKDKEKYIKADLSVSLNLFIRHANLEVSSCKRKRADKNIVQSEVCGLAPTSIDDLDLELRLGDRPKVKGK